MKSSLSLLLSVVVLPSLLAVGCGDDSGGNQDLSGAMNDLAGTRDMTAKACTMIATWPSNDVEVLGGEVDSDPFDFVTIGRALKTTGSTIDAFSVELWHQASTPAAPRTVSLPANGDYSTCETCVLVDENFDPDQGFGDVGYFARSGMVTVTKADLTPSSGMMQVSGTNVQLVEWDFMNDKPVTNGKCYEVGSFMISGSYSNPDGGTDM